MIRKLSSVLLAGLLAMVVGCHPPDSTGPTSPVAKTFSYTKSALGYAAIAPNFGRSLNRAAGAVTGSIFSSTDTLKVLLTTDVLGTTSGVATAAVSNPGLVAILDPVTGFVTPVRNGSLTIVATDAASGDSATAFLMVDSPVDLAAANALTSGSAFASAWKLGSINGDYSFAGRAHMIFAANCIIPSDLQHSNLYNAGTFYITNGALSSLTYRGRGQWTTVNGVLEVANKDVESGTYAVVGNTLVADLTFTPAAGGGTQTHVWTLMATGTVSTGDIQWSKLFN